MASCHLIRYRLAAFFWLLSLACFPSRSTSAAGQGFSPEQSIPKQPPAGTVIVSENSTESLISGIYVNGNDRGTITALLRKGEYWIPWDFFLAESGLKQEETGEGKIRYATSIGSLTFDSNELEQFGTVTCISFSSLKNSFRVFPAFNQSLYAIMLTIPWRPGAPQKSPTAEIKKADVTAPNSSLSFIRLESELLYDFTVEPNKNLIVESGGRILGGTWDITMEGDPEKTMEPSQYHWTSYNRHLAFRAGTGTTDLYSIIGNQSFTGAQFGWTNRNIVRYLDFDRYSDSETFLALDRTQLRTIEGDGPPAGIAELRLDNGVAARQRISLEGKFIFRNVRITSDLRKTEVYLYESSLAEPPLSVLDFTQKLSGRALPKGEIIIRGGSGKSGNVLDSENQLKEKSAYFGHVQYGISKRLSVEAGVTNNIVSGTTDFYGGTILSIGGNWAAALYGAQSNNRYGGEFRLEGNGKHWQTSLWSNLHERYFGNDGASSNEHHALSLSIRPFRTMSISLYGLSDRVNGSLEKEYLLPGISWSLFPGVQISATPNQDETYRYESIFRFSSSSNLRLIYENDVVTADYAHRLSDRFNISAINTYARKTRDNVATCYFNWIPGNISSDMVEAGFSYSNGEFGYSGSLSKFINAGLRIALRYSYNMNNAQALSIDELSFIDTVSEPARYIACALTWDLGWSGKRFRSINRTAVSTTRGGISGSLAIEDDTDLSKSDINNVSILLNGKTMQQQQIGGSFFVGNLLPGVYTVSVDPENLPVELSVDQAARNVEVKSGAVSYISIPVIAHYGISGKITDGSGHAVANAMIEISGKDNAENKRIMSNEFGLYRADELKNGRYDISIVSINGIPINNVSSKSFTIKNDYLFNVDLTVSGITAPLPQ